MKAYEAIIKNDARVSVRERGARHAFSALEHGPAKNDQYPHYTYKKATCSTNDSGVRFPNLQLPCCSIPE